MVTFLTRLLYHFMFSPVSSCFTDHGRTLFSLLRLLAKKDVNLLLNPILGIWSVGIGRPFVNQTGQVSQVVDEIEQLRDVIRDRGQTRVALLQVILEHVTNT